ncbi:probable RNA helicase armi [Drosophila kikkawai]|uniref:RNA helicase n=1 Tax=Drosophila kikkawai TaxID=30033 RepID=A0A6P4ILG7_DROKI|nr:probable RNA helicase armi [Drosophila kikkawai]
MISLLRTWFRNAEREKELKLEQLERENNFLDFQLKEEENQNRRQGNQSSGIEPLISKQSRPIEQKFNGMDINENKETLCSSQKGVITSLSASSGAIDTYIYFDSKAADCVFHELSIGCVVEYLTFQKNPSDVPKVVKVQRIIEDVWEDASEGKIQEAVEKLRIEKPTTFKTEHRNVLGLITSRQPSLIEVDTEYGQFEVKLDNVETTFVPQEGDRVRLVCEVQLDDDFVDKQGEILQVTKVFPQRIEPDQKCVVERVYENLSLLGKHIYVLKADVPSGVNLHLGDLVRADLIECEYSKFTKRAIKLTLMEKSFGVIKFKPTLSSCALDECQSVSLIGQTRHITTELQKRHQISLKVRNNVNRALNLKQVTVENVGESQLSVVEPLQPIDIPIDGEITLLMEVYTKFMGEASEKFQLDFGNFKMRCSIAVIVCETEEEALTVEKRMIAADVLRAPGRTALQRSRFYANQVWSTKRDVVPGQSATTRRRFVALRLGHYDVPEKLRQIYLTTERQSEMFANLEHQYPCFKETLNTKNYVQIFSLFLHLEEIEHFVLMRNYDRDRAHFQRDGEYLSLLIENLAERRPSLVIGDSVRAVNPWADSSQREGNKTYEGIVHKVLFNRVLLKFNASFQEKYNGEDYRLEFGFSRFGLRKQHFAISRIISVMGEDFLFPTKLEKRPQPQLELRLVDEEDMYLYDSKLRWFNPTLNRIQKRAVFNILRGESQNLPYVIFGPPGTGKTMTLVEVLLQLAENVPGARVLVGTPSNSSADLITKRVIESNVLPQGDFVRLVSFNQIEKEMIPPELMSYCATVDIGTSGTCADSMVITESGLKLRCQMKFIGRHRVTISTNTTLGNFMQMGFPTGHFTHVLIDEAGQCTEPETMVPISLLVRNKSQVVLAGDPRQLQAIVINRFSSHRDYAKSFLERLLDRHPYNKDLQRFPDSSGYNPMCLTKLLNNYRALPSIMCTYSKLFYDDELIPMVSETDSREIRLLEKARAVFKPVKDIPIKQGAFFFGIDGRNMQESDSPSWYNPLEAKEVFFTTIALYRANVHEDQIGILTPYAKQVKTIRNLFKGTDVVMPKIGSVEEFQGQERDIMLISTVRSSQALIRSDSQLSLGFVKSSKRMNVAISRARAMMVVFGNPNLLALDDSWRRYITYCAHNNALFGCELPDSIVYGNAAEEEQEEKDIYT